MTPKSLSQPVCDQSAGPSFSSGMDQPLPALRSYGSLGNAKEWDSGCRPEDTAPVSSAIADTPTQKIKDYRQQLSVGNEPNHLDAGNHSSGSSATMTELNDSFSSSPSPKSYESRRARQVKPRALTIPLLAQKAENISRLDRPSLGPRSPRCEEFGISCQTTSPNSNSNACPSQSDIKAGASNWKDRVGHILTSKKSTNHIRDEAPTSPYRLMTISGESSQDNLQYQLPPCGPKTIQVRHPPQEKVKAESVRALSINEKSTDDHPSCSSRPLSYDRGVASLSGCERVATIEELRANEAPPARTDESTAATDRREEDAPTFDAEQQDDMIGTAMTVDCLDDQNQDTEPTLHTVRTPDRPSRPTIQPRSSSKQPIKGDCNPSCCDGPHGTSNGQCYRTGSTETIRIYGGLRFSINDESAEQSVALSASPTRQSPDPFSIDSIVDNEVYGLQVNNHYFGTVPEHSPMSTPLTSTRAYEGEEVGIGAGLAVSNDFGIWSPGNVDASKQAEPSTTNSRPPKKPASARTRIVAPPERVAINFSRKESMQQMRLATRKVLKQRQQNLVAGRASLEQKSPVDKNTVFFNRGNTSPTGKQKKGSLLPIPKRILYGDVCSYRTEADSSKTRQEHLPSAQQACQENALSPSEKTSMTLTERPSSAHPDTNMSCAFSHTEALKGDDKTANGKEETARSILLEDGYTLKQLSDHSPVHGPQLRVAPDAEKLLIGNPAEGSRQTRKTRFPFQDFRMSEPLFAAKSMGAIPASSSSRLLKPKRMGQSQSATCLTSGDEGQSTKNTGADEGINSISRNAPVVSSGQSEISLQKQRSKLTSPTPEEKGTTFARTTGQTPQYASAAAGQNQEANASVQQDASATTSCNPLSPGSAKPPQPAPIRNPQVGVTGDANGRLGAPAPIREVPSSSSLQSRFYSESRTTIPLPRNMVQTKYSGESLTRDCKALPKLPAQVRSEQLNNAPARKDESSTVVQNGNMQSQPTGGAHTHFSGVLNGDMGQHERRPDVRPSNEDPNSSRIARKSSRTGRNMLSNIRGLFSRSIHKTVDLRDAPAAVQPALRQRAKLVRKESRPLQKQRHAPGDGRQHERQHLRYRDRIRNGVEGRTTATPKHPPMNKRVLSPRVVPWPPPLAGEGSSSKPNTAIQGNLQPNQRSNQRTVNTERDHAVKETMSGCNALSQIAATGAQASQVEQSLPAQSDINCVNSDPAHLDRVSRVSDLTEYTMQLLKAARREDDDVRKVNMIKLAKTLVQAVNHAHEAEKSMLMAAQAARRAEFSCAQAQESALRIGDIAREAMRIVQGGGNDSTGEN